MITETQSGPGIMAIITSTVLEEVGSYNEAEVRFHVIDPLLRQLGYPGGDDIYLKLEEKLDYPYFYIGHKNKKKDLPLGFPDYRAGLKGRRGSFIVEAKAATVGISPRDIEQAHSYAAHSNVGANYFMLSDGTQVSVYATLSGGHEAPIVCIPLAEIDARFHEIENVLSPRNLARNCRVDYDNGQKLCEGLGSSIRLLSGTYDMNDYAYRVLLRDQDITDAAKGSLGNFAEVDRQLSMMQREFELRVGEGVVKRSNSGKIFADVSFVGVTKNNSSAMKLLGMDRMAFETDAQFISTSSEEPTLFESTADFAVTKGTMMPPLFGDAVPMDINVDGDLLVSARMHLTSDTILGEYSAAAEYRLDIPMLGAVKIEFEFTGTCSLKLAS